MFLAHVSPAVLCVLCLLFVLMVRGRSVGGGCDEVACDCCVLSLVICFNGRLFYGSDMDLRLRINKVLLMKCLGFT